MGLSPASGRKRWGGLRPRPKAALRPRLKAALRSRPKLDPNPADPPPQDSPAAPPAPARPSSAGNRTGSPQPQRAPAPGPGAFPQRAALDAHKSHPGTKALPANLEPVGSQALVRFLPTQSNRSTQQGEKTTVNWDTTADQKRAEESNLALQPRGDGRLVTQVTKQKLKPQPGDLIEIFRIGYEHWAIYVEDDCVVHLAPPSEEFEVGSITSIFSNRAVVKYSHLNDVLHGCSWKVNNKLDGTYLPLPVEEIIQRTKQMVNKIVQYSLIEGNCEHFVNNLRYGVSRSQQVEHILMKGMKAAGVVISAVVDSMKPKPITA